MWDPMHVPLLAGEGSKAGNCWMSFWKGPLNPNWFTGIHGRSATRWSGTTVACFTAGQDMTQTAGAG